MASKMRLSAVAFLCVVTGGLTAIPATPVNAQGFFEGIFGGQRYQRGDRWGRNAAGYAPPGYAQPADPQRGYYRYRNAPRDPRAALWGWGSAPEPAPQEAPRSGPSVYVSSPKYYTYEADQPKVATFGELAEVDTAAAGPIGRPALSSPFTAARDHLASFEMRVLPEVADAIKTHYKRYPEFVWSDGKTVNGRAYSAIAAFERADDFGLTGRDYAVELPRPGSALSPDAQNKAMIEFELAMSASALSYVLDATRGRIDPNRISGYHDFKRKAVDLAGELPKLASLKEAGPALEAHNPDNVPFAALASELKRLRGAGSAPRIEIAQDTFLKPGGSSPELANIVAAIRQVGSPALKDEHGAVLAAYDGAPTYTPEIAAVVRSFQREKGLSADGIVGRNTIRAMVPESNDTKIRKIELALERLRWLPRDLGTRHVLINQPAFTATLFEGDREALSMRAVVGQKANQTYFFSDEIETVEYNPYWGVPRSIIVNEMLPKLYADPSYLDRAGYEVSSSSGRRVSSSSVDWGAVASNRASVDVRQPPGAGNALGAVKILFPNAHAIYMHDTPQKELFKRDSRAFSHGCVRLHEPREMAAAVLGKSLDYVNSQIGAGRNLQEKLEVKVPVHVAYFTAWPNADGSVSYFDDVYERDDYLSKAIERTEAVRHAEG